MKIKTADIIISKRVQEEIIANWKKPNESELDSDVLDSEFVSKTSRLAVKLRIPWEYKVTNYMIIHSEVLFVPRGGQILLSIVCNLMKPIILFTFLGFLTSMVFVLPIFAFPTERVFIPFLAGLLISGIYFRLFYIRIQRISLRFLKELAAQYHKQK